MATYTPATIEQLMLAIREEIIHAFEELEGGESFIRTSWEHPTGGGGEMAVLRGSHFEKAAVNFSHVWGPQYPLGDIKEPYEACGVSLITHMSNPKAPTSHMNIRYIQKGDLHWVGGGFDLTPMGFLYEEDTFHLHSIAERRLLPFGKDLYPLFSKNAKEYFYIPHRKRERGIGGIFFDEWNTGNIQSDLALLEEVARGFLEVVIPIYKRRIHEPYTHEDKKLQKKQRGAYVEFNLLYDRGTKFGFHSGGNPEAILCSLPPEVTW